MRTLLFIGGPLIATIGFGFYSGLISFVEEHPGLEHQAGVPMGGAFEMRYEETYQCDESDDNCVLIDTSTEVSELDTELTEIEGLELEDAPIEYREGSEDTYVRRQPGLAKYANIIVRRPDGFDWNTFKFVFDAEVRRENCEDCNDGMHPQTADYDPADLNSNVEDGQMIQIDPPKTVFPVGQR